MGKRGCAAVVVGFLLIAADLATAQSQPASSAANITILLDLSYGMRLPLSLNKDDTRGPTRLDEARRLLRTVLDNSAPSTRWSLITFGGTPEASIDSGPRLRLGFTVNRTEVETELGRLSTWGVSPLSESILYAERYSDRNARGPRRVLLVISDGIDTMPSLFEMPSPETLGELPTRIVFAGITSRLAPELALALRSWLTAAGGLYVDGADPIAVVEAIRRAEERSAAPRVSPRARVTQAPGLRAERTRSDTSVETSGPARTSRSARSAVLAFLPLPLLLLVGYLLLRRARRVRRPHGPPHPTRAAVLRFRCEAHDDIDERELAELPAELSFDGRGGSTAPVIELRNGRVFLISATPVLVNGVEVRRAGLKEGDRIRTGPVLWTFRGVKHRVDGAPASATGAPFWPAAAAAVAVAVLLVIGLRPAERSAVPGRSTAASIPTVHALPGPAGGSHPGAAAGGSVNTETGPLGPGFVALAGTTAPVRPFVHTVMIAPGERPEFFKADVMFIHTHPDDDSIDFGGLMAVESRAGKRIVTVVFTDGNAGLDQYPNRRVGGIYPPHALRGNALAAVRIRDTVAALSVLGAREYIRLGLVNNPYDSITEVLPLHEVLRRWGGETRLVRELAGLIQGFRPGIVVSPDEHHRGVFKHFEHEAVGYLTNRALAYLARRGETFVRAHLIAVDPMLTSQYNGVFGVDVMRVDAASGLTYRAIQVAALKEHVTQRDASIIGVEVVPNFADEYYVARSWGFGATPREYFARLTGAGGG